jgi:hypothetical protein
LYFRRLLAFFGFSEGGLRDNERDASCCGRTELAVCDLGRGRPDMSEIVGNKSGDAAVEWCGDAICDEVVDDDVVMVWYVRTGSLSTTDFGALHRRRRIRDLSSSNP